MMSRSGTGTSGGPDSAAAPRARGARGRGGQWRFAVQGSTRRGNPSGIFNGRTVSPSVSEGSSGASRTRTSRPSSRTCRKRVSVWDWSMDQCRVLVTRAPGGRSQETGAACAASGEGSRPSSSTRTTGTSRTRPASSTTETRGQPPIAQSAVEAFVAAMTECLLPPRLAPSTTWVRKRSPARQAGAGASATGVGDSPGSAGSEGSAAGPRARGVGGGLGGGCAAATARAARRADSSTRSSWAWTQDAVGMLAALAARASARRAQASR